MNPIHRYIQDISLNLIYNQTKYFFMEIINTFKQSIAKFFDSTNVFVSCKT